MLDWLSSTFRYHARTITAIPYTEQETRAIETAGNKAAFDMIQDALNQKIAALGLHCPIIRHEKGFSNELVLAAGNLKNSPFRSEVDAFIFLRFVGNAAHLETTLKADEVWSNLVRFDVRCPKNGIYGNSSRKFMEFFEALGIKTLREFMSMNDVKPALQAGNTNWLGHSMGGFFDAATSGSIAGVTYGNAFCPTVRFLESLDIAPTTFARAITAARVEKARQFGPVRETRLQTLTYGKAFG